MPTSIVKLSIVATFEQGGQLGYVTALETITLDLDRETDAAARISVNIGAFIEIHIDSKEGREDRKLVSLSHSLIPVPS